MIIRTLIDTTDEDEIFFLQNDKVRHLYHKIEGMNRMFLSKKGLVVTFYTLQDKYLLVVYENEGQLEKRKFYAYECEKEDDLIKYAEGKFNITISQVFERNKMKFILN